MRNFRTYPKEPINPTAPDFDGAVIGAELVTLDEVKQALRVDFAIDELEINAIRIAARLRVEKEANRLVVDREGQAATITPNQKDTIRVCILALCKQMYNGEPLPDFYKILLNSFSQKIFAV